MACIEEQKEYTLGLSPKVLSPGFAAQFQQGILRSFEQFDMKRSQSTVSAGERSPLASGTRTLGVIHNNSTLKDSKDNLW